MKKNKIVLLTVLGALVASIIGFIVIFIILEARQEIKLQSEISKINNSDLSKDSIDMNIKTKKEYGVVEKVIKDYYFEYSDYLKETNDIINEDQLNNILTIENYENDGPDFKGSIKYLDDILIRFNEKIIRLQEMAQKKYIENLIYNKDLDNYYIDLYNNYMFYDNDTSDFENLQIDIKNVKEQMELIMKTSKETLTFLKDNQDYWYIEDKYIMFDNDELLAEYNKIISSLNTVIY